MSDSDSALPLGRHAGSWVRGSLLRVLLLGGLSSRTWPGQAGVGFLGRRAWSKAARRGRSNAVPKLGQGVDASCKPPIRH